MRTATLLAASALCNFWTEHCETSKMLSHSYLKR